MAIELADMITPEKKLLIQKIDQTIEEMIPALQQGVDEGLPLADHLAWYKDKQQWIQKFMRLFKVTKMMDS